MDTKKDLNEAVADALEQLMFMRFRINNKSSTYAWVDNDHLQALVNRVKGLYSRLEEECIDEKSVH